MPRAFIAVDAHPHALGYQVADGDGVRPLARIEGHGAKRRERISSWSTLGLRRSGIRLDESAALKLQQGY